MARMDQKMKPITDINVTYENVPESMAVAVSQLMDQKMKPCENRITQLEESMMIIIIISTVF